MKVRLKLDFEVREHGLIMFQFHEGPIKTPCRLSTPLAASPFQFHEGPIKTQIDLPLKSITLNRFNSMKVRLKHHYKSPSRAWAPSFNSMKVRLKLVPPLTQVTGRKFQFHEGPIKTHCIFQ